MNHSKIKPETLESHFIFFYDLGVKITAEINPSSDMKESATNTFSWRTISKSELCMFYFSDNFVARFVPAHFHGTPETINVGDILVTDSGKTFVFDFPQWPIGMSGGTPPHSYHHLEVTIFSNGMLSVLLRLRNKSEIEYDEYLKLIKHPEFLLDEARASYEPGELVLKVRSLIIEVEKHLAAYLNALNIKCVTMDSGEERTLLITDNSDARHIICPGNVVYEDGYLKHHLKRSRPYVGTIIDLSGEAGVSEIDENDPKYEEFEKLAIACGRTTPAFLDMFAHVKEYMSEGDPRRNIYYPGKSIVFIGRRGWSCIKLDDRNPIAFQMGIVETVIFALESMHSSVRATRRYAQQLVNRGEKISKSLYMAAMGDSQDTDDVLGTVTLGEIRAFTKFLTLARQNSPINNLESILVSHMTTHTGITAVKRIQALTGLNELIDNTKQILDNYSSILNISNQYWASTSRKHQAKSFRWFLVGLSASIIGILANICLQLILRR